MIYDKQKIVGWIDPDALARLERGRDPYMGYSIYARKKGWKDERVRVPCYYNPPEHPSTVMSNVFECVVSINSLFDERNK